MAPKKRKIVRRCGKRELDIWDRISQLPDEILVCILSLLSFKEATATSVLSSRWMHLRECYWRSTRQLDFHASNWLWEKVQATNMSGGCPYMLVQKERVKYVKWVNKVLLLHKGSTLVEFRIGFDLGRAYQHDFNNWLKFALARKVERLELDLLTYGKKIRLLEDCCSFPGEILAQSSVPPLGKPYLNCDDIKSLKALSLKGVNVSDEYIRYFLSNCPALEWLIVNCSEALENVEVSGPSVVLRHLEIFRCDSLKSIKICNSKLVSFTCCLIPMPSVCLRNNPLLVEVNIGYALCLTATFFMLSSHLSQLQVLILCLNNSHHQEPFHREIPKLSRLKQLVVELSVQTEESLVEFASLVKASPRLHKFAMKIKVLRSFKKRSVFKFATCCHDHLKVAVVEGYYGGTSDLEVVSYLLHNAVALEELIIDPRDPYRANNQCGDKFYKYEKAGRNFAKQHFEGKVPSQVRLSIL